MNWTIGKMSIGWKRENVESSLLERQVIICCRECRKKIKYVKSFDKKRETFFDCLQNNNILNFVKYEVVSRLCFSNSLLTRSFKNPLENQSLKRFQSAFQNLFRSSRICLLFANERTNGFQMRWKCSTSVRMLSIISSKVEYLWSRSVICELLFLRIQILFIFGTKIILLLQIRFGKKNCGEFKTWLFLKKISCFGIWF